MLVKYMYSPNGIWNNFFRGLLPLARGSLPVSPFLDESHTYVWRNNLIDGYKVSLGY